MPRRSSISVFLSLLILWNCDSFAISAQEVAPQNQATTYLDGLLVAKKKYSFTVGGLEKDQVVHLDPATVVAVRIVRPAFDWKQWKVTGQIPASAPDGRARNNLKVAYELPKKLYFRHRFESSDKMDATLSMDPVPLSRLVLSKLPLRDAVSDSENPEWTGELIVDSAKGEFRARFKDKEVAIDPTWSTLLVEGLNLLDVNPFETDVFVNAFEKEGKLIAKRVEFAPRLNLEKIFAGSKPKCLVIGDTISFNYMAALIKELDGEAAIYHPNSNCLGSASFKHLHRWLAVNQERDFNWDVIAFNFGHADNSLDKADYQANLKKCIDILNGTKADLIWVESTPVPYGFNDPKLKPGGIIPDDQQFDFEFEEPNANSLKPGRMKVQNQWAEETLQSYPAIRICKLWDIVKKDNAKKYKTWWYGKVTNFKYPQSLPLAKNLASIIRDCLKP